MGIQRGSEIKPAQGKLGVLLPGMGAVATTFIAGVEAIRRGLAQPVGSLTQLGTIRIGKRTENKNPKISDFVPLAGLDDLVFGGWDIFTDDAYEAAAHAGVLKPETLAQIKPFLQSVRPMAGVFEPQWVKKLHGTHVKTGTSKRDLAEQLIADIAAWKQQNDISRCVAIWCGSTEVYQVPSAVHASLAAFEAGLDASDEAIAPSAIYAYALHQEWGRVCQRRAEPVRSTSRRCTSSRASSKVYRSPARTFKTGQTLDEDGDRARCLKARMLGLDRLVFSTNILGNRDGEVLDDPRLVQDQRDVEARRARVHPAAAPLPGAVQRVPPRRPHQLLPSARRQQRGLGQHRHLWLARLSDADQGRFPVPRFDLGCADCA
jgi:myo-inositol-1-phosphate synthase